MIIAFPHFNVINESKDWLLYIDRMNRSIHSTTPHFEKKKVARFHRLDNDHISAIESLFQSFPFLKDRVEIHMPFSRAKPTFSSGTVWMWPKFDKRPVGYLIFMDGFAPCIWYPERQEGMTFRWLLPPAFCQAGPIVFLANILAGESLLQIEDLIIHQGTDLWSSRIFSERWTTLQEVWASLPPDQPLLAFTPRLVKPIALADWQEHYNPSIYWIIQPDHARQPRWYWKDTVTMSEHKPVEYVAPVLKRSNEIATTLCAYCTPYTKAVLPDIYSLAAQEGLDLGVASIASMTLSMDLRKIFAEKAVEKVAGVPVEVVWNENFHKYQIVRILPADRTITPSSFFYHI